MLRSNKHVLIIMWSDYFRDIVNLNAITLAFIMVYPKKYSRTIFI